MKKKNEGAILPKVSATTEIQVLRGGVSKQRVLLIVAVSLLVGFILGATVAILKTKKETKGIAVTAEPEKEEQANYEEDIRLAQSILEKDPRNLEALIALFTGAEKAKEEKKKG